jgi:DNA (cytosine-5)-methyltransferase 1
MKVLSLFSGVGGFDMGLENAGMETVFQCEWDKHANSILHKHWPDVPKWDDVSTLTGKHILAHAPVVDVVAWGSPCQDLSVAGKRAGLEGGRSGLFHEGIRIIKELQEETNGQYPRISIWENVVGALNSNRGADFGIIIDEMAEAGALAIEWSVLDAQYFGIPQRRRRVFVIAIFDPVLANRSPNPLLPVSESLPRHLAKSKPKRKSITSETSESVGADGQWAAGTTPDGDILRTSVTSKWHKGSGGPSGSEYYNMVVEDQPILIDRAAFNQGENALYQPHISDDPISPSLVAQGPHAVFVKSSRAQTSEDSETWIQGEVNPTLNSFDVGDTRATTAIIEEPIFFQAHQSGEARVKENVMHTLSAMMGTGGNNVPLLAFDTQFGSNANVTEEVSPTLKASQQSPSVAYGSEPTMAVRRLTPLECERLMGWPDDHTRYKADGTEQADTHRYKQCGNGVASPVAQWIAKHILNI